eukprot:Seg4150.2 transcript_id=Seg4150.2/GoldUCD/mRNA.D3Y31 product=Ketosamine-3-kinase protein_id=Seg4150.2/GoldUCD/D3Y31
MPLSRLRHSHKEAKLKARHKMADLKEIIRESLGVSSVKDLGATGGGCISNSRKFQTENGNVFVKTYEQEKGEVMFRGEFESLKKIMETNTVTVPAPLKVVTNEEKHESIFIMEFIEMKSLSKFQAKLGEQLARLHLHNRQLLERNATNEQKIGSEGLQGVTKFGFHVRTCCGMIPQDNSWNESWIEFFTRQKLQPQIDMLLKEYQDRELQTLWSELQLIIDKFFKDLSIKPSLLHGDLWSGNAAETTSGPVIYDPASFYGHDEYDLAIAGMFGGFNKQFYDAYHKLIPKAKGFDERHTLYTLFHYLNHWNHFGSGYRSQSIGIMKKLLSHAKKS